ncbi:MAG: hypothetical protein HOL13_01210 [Phycisphaerae bacterium]|nr:hypothetical protein [Phycisphaerae bacterium]
MTEHDQVVQAWQRLGEPTLLEGDMLWALFGPTLGEGTSDAVLSALSGAISPGGVVRRAARLVPVLQQRYGAGSAQGLLSRARSMASNTRQRRAIDAIQ